MVLQAETGVDRTTETVDPGLSEDIGWSAAESVLGTVSEEQLRDLVEGAAPREPELWAQSLAERAARLDTSNMAAMLAAAANGAKLAECLQTGGTCAAALRARARRGEEQVRGGAHAGVAPARDDLAQRQLLAELERLFAWLDAPALRDLDAPQDLSGTEGRARALALGNALRTALRAESTASPALRRLSATTERLRKLARARDRHAAAIARHLNNLLIHLGNEAAAGSAGGAGDEPRHHAELLPYAPFMRWLKEMDEKSYDALVKVYVGTWARVHERAVHAWGETARAAPPPPPPPPAQDCVLDAVLVRVRRLCDAEQDFCTQFLCLDYDAKAEASDGERSEKSSGGESGGAGGAGAAGGARRGSESRRLFAELFPALEPELLALVAHVERLEPYGAFRALACASRHVLSEPAGAGSAGAGAGPGAGGEGRWAGAAVAAAAVAAKRAADRAVSERLAALPEQVKQAQKKPKCGVLPFVSQFSSLAAACEAIFERGRRADLERCYGTVLGAVLAAIAAADHPRTPRAVIQLENYHSLHGELCALRVAALEPWRREARARYQQALSTYVSQYFGRPLEGLTAFCERVGDALAAGARPHEVRYRPACSKQELRRVLALYPPHEVRKSLRRLYRAVEKHLSDGDGGLLQVVWRAMQEELLQQHTQLQARITACYPGSGLAMPLTTQDILDAFSDIAREH